jgi:6,7-dimethyl-8-ribityllumazine synthase
VTQHHQYKTSNSFSGSSSTKTGNMSSLKGPTTEQHDGSGLRVAIVHARWNTSVIEPLVRGAKEKLLACGVKEGNIVVQSCPGAYELPITSQR